MPARTTALAALIACRRAGAWSDGILKEYLARDGLDRRDAALATQLCCGVMQQRLLLDWRLRQVSSQPLEKLQPVVLDILRLGAYQIGFLDRVPDSAAVNEAVEQAKRYANARAGGYVNGVLRALSGVQKAQLHNSAAISRMRRWPPAVSSSKICRTGRISWSMPAT